MSDLFGLPVHRDPFDPERLIVGLREGEIRFEGRLTSDYQFFSKMFETPKYDVKLMFGDLTLAIDKVSLAMCDYGTVLHGTTASMKDLEWRLHWYVDPSAAWWER